ncbi:MAG: FAD-binding oxidoreductase [Actinobacteria bacterium]|nr:MAG: FAD-binding oxidoreductase [Actinomycetota bacterium]
MQEMTRRELLARGGRVALVAGGVSLGRPLVRLARASAGGIYDELASGLRGEVVLPSSSAYDQARLLFDTRFDTVMPRAIVFCESTADVQRTVRWAREHAVRIVPRAGGHSYGGYSTTTGVIVDVSRLNGITLDPDRRAIVGAGARLIDVYQKLALHGRTVPAGSCPTVGIAGLALGGGVGFASRKYGLTCDNLLEATVVLADGSAVVANAHAHPDLYWALRGGGGGSFGIVTRLVFRTHPVGQLATYAIEWPWPDAAKVVQAWQKLAPYAPDGLFSVLNLNSVVAGRARVTSAGQLFGSADRLRALVKPLANAGTSTRFTVTSRSYLDAQEMWAGCSGTIAECHLPPQGQLGRSTFKGKSSFANKPLSLKGINAMIRQIESRITTGSGSGVILLDSYGGAINRVKKDATAFVHRDAIPTSATGSVRTTARTSIA